MDRVRNEMVRNRAMIHQTLPDRVELKGMKWFGRLMRMEEMELPKKNSYGHHPENVKVACAEVLEGKQ